MDVAEALAASLESWAQFPVHASERRIVPIGSLVREVGYLSGEAKLAFAQKRLRVDPSVSLDAVASLVAEIGPLATETEQSLAVRSAVRVLYPFNTDRGPQELRCWSLQVDDSLGQVTVIDIEERERLWFPPDARSRGGGTATYLDADCSRLRYRFVGVPRVYADYDGVDLATSDAAVAVLPRVHYAVSKDQPMRSYGEIREVEIHLAEPVGARVLVTDTGYPIEVLTPDHASPTPENGSELDP
jgi:hypothetical protein